MRTFYLKLLLLLFLIPSVLMAGDSISDQEIISSPTYSLHPNWKSPSLISSSLTAYDTKLLPFIKRLSKGKQSHLLIVGSSYSLAPYLFSRLAHLMNENETLKQRHHVAIQNLNLASDHKYVGDIEKYWSSSVRELIQTHSVVFYFPMLYGLIGLGSHEHKSTGVEIYLADDLKKRDFYSIAFISLEHYNYLKSKKDANYVLSSFGTPLFINQPDFNEWENLIDSYLLAQTDEFQLTSENKRWLYEKLNNYLNTTEEPERSFQFLDQIISKKNNRDDEAVIEDYLIHKEPTEGPIEWEIKREKASSISLQFQTLNIENASYTAYGKAQKKSALRVYDCKKKSTTPPLLDEITGNNPLPFTTGPYLTNHLCIKWEKEGTPSAFSFGPKEGFDLYRISYYSKSSFLLTQDEIWKELKKYTQLPDWIQETDYKRLENLGSSLESKFVGIEKKLKMISTTLLDNYITERPEKPLASFLLLGTTGTGKTYLPKILAELLELPRFVFDMTRYKTVLDLPHFESALSEKLRMAPYGIYVFEEIDKTTPSAIQQLFFLLDEGQFYLNDQTSIPAHHAIIFMTTNIGTQVILQNPHAPNLYQLVEKDLYNSGTLEDSFLNRFDRKIVFDLFTENDYLKLAQILWAKEAQLIQKNKKIAITTDDQFLQFISLYGINPRMGARPMERIVEQILRRAIGQYCTEVNCYKPEPHTIIHIGAGRKEEDRIIFKVEVVTNQKLKRDFDTSILIEKSNS